MLEAYKKFIVVSLIHHGKVTVLPKYTSQVVSRFIKVGFHTVYNNNNNNNMTLVKRKHIHLTSRRSRRDKEKRWTKTSLQAVSRQLGLKAWYYCSDNENNNDNNAKRTHSIMLVEWACAYCAWSDSTNTMRSLCVVIVLFSLSLQCDLAFIPQGGNKDRRLHAPWHCLDAPLNAPVVYWVYSFSFPESTPVCPRCVRIALTSFQGLTRVSPQCPACRVGHLGVTWGACRHHERAISSCQGLTRVSSAGSTHRTHPKYLAQGHKYPY